jgi:hypothetical protein
VLFNFPVKVSAQVGVGHAEVAREDPDACSVMRRSGIGSCHNSPSRIIPQRGKISENSVKPSAIEHWAVLHENERRLNLANDPGHFGPQSTSLPIKPITLSSQ